MALTAQQLQRAYAQAMKPCEISIMHREYLERLMLDKPQAGLKISHLLSKRLRCYESRLEDLTLKGPIARLASLLLLLLESEGVVSGEHQLKIPTTPTSILERYRDQPGRGNQGFLQAARRRSSGAQA